MTIDKDCQLFFGCKIDSKLREALSQATPGDRHYFEDPSSPYLRICVVGEEKWIGKVMNAGLNVLEVEDVQRNVVSILRRVAPDMRHNPANIKIFALGTEEAEALPEPQQQSRGPYIG